MFVANDLLGTLHHDSAQCNAKQILIRSCWGETQMTVLQIAIGAGTFKLTHQSRPPKAVLIVALHLFSESLCTRDSRAQCDFPMRAESSLCWLSLRLQGKPWDNTKVSFAGRKRTRMYSSLDPVRPSSAFQLASPVVEHQYQDVGAKSYPSGQALGEQVGYSAIDLPTEQISLLFL